MRLGEVHHHESQHGERINIVFAGVLCSSCIPRNSVGILQFASFVSEQKLRQLKI